MITFLRLQWAEAVGVVCKCGTPLDAHDYPTDHVGSCVRVEKDSRHNTIRDFMALLYKQLPGHGISVRAEQHIYGDERRVDHVVIGVANLNKNLCTDHTIVDPTADTNINDGSADTKNAAANKANEGKVRDHTAALQQRGLTGLYEFVPVAMEVWGGLHASFVKRLHGWAEQLAEQELGAAANATEEGQKRVGIVAAQTLEGWRRTLSVGLVKARVKHAWTAISDCVSRDAAAATTSVQGAGCFMQLGNSASARLRFGVGGHRDFRRRDG